MIKPARKTITHIKNSKNKTPLVCLTAYTAPMAKLLDHYCDILLVGDSLGMSVYGLDSTIGVTVEMMCNHGAAVVRGSQESLVVVDMPFASYQASKKDAFNNAALILSSTRATAVKLEGGVEMAATVDFLTKRGIPVMGHIGLKPQSVNALGGYRFQGRTEEEKQLIKNDALALEKAGAFAVVIEGVRESLAASISKELTIPTIGIGASPSCDGQILVAEDMLGLFGDNVPSFVKIYTKMDQHISQAVRTYADEVRHHNFPTENHCFEPSTKIQKINHP